MARIAAAAALCLCLCLVAAFVGQGRAGWGAVCRGTSPSLLQQGSEKTEQHTVAVRLRNVAATACGLDGYPSISLADGAGRVLAFDYDYRGDQMITGARPVLVRLAPRGSAYFAFNKNVCVGRTDRLARTLRMTLPGAGGSRSIRLPRSVYIDYCGPNDPGHAITVSPIVAHVSGAYCYEQGTCKRR